MDSVKNKILSDKSGMTLMEVMIAVFLFAVFITAFMTGQGNNILSSSRMKDDFYLKDLAEMQYNLTLLDPPDFSKRLIDAKTETKAFEDYPGYEYTLTYQQIFIPDLTKIMGEDPNQEPSQRANQKKILEEFKANMEKLVWQINILVRNKETQQTYELAGWTYYGDAKVTFKGF